MCKEAAIDRLPLDLLAYIFSLVTSFTVLAQASGVCKKWRKAVNQSMARRESLSFVGWKMDDDSISRLVHLAYNLKELDISRSRWGCHITDNGLYQIASARCVANLNSVSLWGMTAITDSGVVQLISRTSSLQHLNIGGTFITDESLFAIAERCHHLRVIFFSKSMDHIGDNSLIPDSPFSFQRLLCGDDWHRWDTYPTVDANAISPDPTVERNRDDQTIESDSLLVTLSLEETVEQYWLQSSTNEQSETASQEDYIGVSSDEDSFTYEELLNITEDIGDVCMHWCKL